MWKSPKMMVAEGVTTMEEVQAVALDQEVLQHQEANAAQAAVVSVEAKEVPHQNAKADSLQTKVRGAKVDLAPHRGKKAVILKKHQGVPNHRVAKADLQNVRHAGLKVQQRRPEQNAQGKVSIC